jgi:hypothetical protein
MLICLKPNRRNLFGLFLLSLCLGQPSALQAVPEPESAVVAEATEVRSLNLKFSGTALIRGQYQRTGKELRLLLPMPGKDRPETMESTANSGVRLLTLIPLAGQTDVPESLMGRWQVVSGVMDGKETDLFNGDEIMFDASAVRIVEKKNASDYAGTYHLPDSGAKMSEGQSSGEGLVKTLRGKFKAVVDESSTGELTGLSLHGLQKNSASAWSDELSDLLGQVPGLKSLTVTDFEFSDASLQLMFLTKLSQLESLDLRKTNVDDAALTHLSQLNSLRILKLEYNQKLTDKALEHIAGLTQLSELDLAFVPVTDQSIESLTQLKSLTKLYLYGTLISDEGLRRLPELPELEILYVGRDEGAEISDASLEILTARKSLKTLGIPGTRFSPEGIQKLRDELPNCTLVGTETVQKASTVSEPAVPMGNGTANSTVTLNDHSVELKHAFAYRTPGKATDLVTILVTSEPVRISDLETALSRYGDDYTFAPFMDQVRIRLSDNGTVESVHIVVDGKTVNDAGPHITASITVMDNEISGTAAAKGTAKANGLSYSMNVQFKTVIQVPEFKAVPE